MSSHWVEKGVASGHRTLPDHGQSVGQSTGSNQVVVDGTISLCSEDPEHEQVRTKLRGKTFHGKTDSRAASDNRAEGFLKKKSYSRRRYYRGPRPKFIKVCSETRSQLRFEGRIGGL